MHLPLLDLRNSLDATCYFQPLSSVVQHWFDKYVFSYFSELGVIPTSCFY